METLSGHSPAGPTLLAIRSSYISSAGLGVFMAFIEDVRENEGDIKLTNMSPKVYNVFDLLGFPLLYEILKDEQDAVNRFFDKAQ